MNNSVAVLIPTKNRRNLLERALYSVHNQSVQPDEVIVINDGSTDDTGDFLHTYSKQYPYVKVITMKESGGVNAARNKGIQSLMSQWVVFLDDDDELLSDAVALVKEKISTIDEGYSIIFFNTRIRNEQGEYVGGFQFNSAMSYYDPSYADVMTKYGLHGDCKPVFRKELFSAHNYWFDESVNGFESVTIRNIIKDGYKIRYYKDISTVVNQHATINHISISAPAKNPRAYLLVHKKDLQAHYGFYITHKGILKVKYKEMAKLAYRSGLYGAMCKYVYLSIITL